MTQRNIGNGYYALRFKVLQRDNFTCRYCGQYAPNVKLEVDHLTTVEDGGRDEEDNLVTSCYACNRGRSGLRIILERKDPRLPRFMFENKHISRPQQVLSILEQNPNGIPITEIAEQAAISIANVNTVLLRLRKRGLIEKIKWGLWRALPLSSDCQRAMKEPLREAKV